MWKRLLHVLFPGRSPDPSRRRETSVNAVPHGQHGAAVYPPNDRGLPIQTSEALIHGQSELVSMLRLHAASSPALFESRFMAPINRLAQYANTLPGSSSAAFAGAGGLFRASLELAFANFRASDGRIFTGALGVEERHRLEARWRYVCFATGLLYPLGAALSNMLVMDEAGKQWSPELESLQQWVQSRKADRVYVTWRNELATLGPSALAGTFALTIIGRDNVEWLNDGSQELVKVLVNIVTGSQSSNNLIASSLTKEMWTAITAREMARLHQNYGKLTIGSNVAPWLLDAMVALSDTKWRLNKAVMFLDASGLYLEWPLAGRDIVAFCTERGITGIPSSDASLLDLLTGTQLVEKGVDGVGLCEIADCQGEIKTAVRVLQPAMLVSDADLASAPTLRSVSMKLVMAQDPLRDRSAPSASQSMPAAQDVSKGKPKGKATRLPPALEQVDSDEIQAVLGSEPGAHGVDDRTPQVDDELDDASTVMASRATGAQREGPTTRGPEPATGGQAAGKADAPALSAGPVPSTSKATQSPGAIVEGGEIRYGDLLPADVVVKLRPHDGEILGKLVHLWRKRSTSGKVLRMCEHGAAFEFALLKDFARDPPGFLTVLGDLGMLYLSPTHGAKKVFPLPASEGSQSMVVCFILAHHTARKLRLE